MSDHVTRYRTALIVALTLAGFLLVAVINQTRAVHDAQAVIRRRSASQDVRVKELTQLRIRPDEGSVPSFTMMESGGVLRLLCITGDRKWYLVHENDQPLYLLATDVLTPPPFTPDC